MNYAPWDNFTDNFDNKDNNYFLGVYGAWEYLECFFMRFDTV